MAKRFTDSEKWKKPFIRSMKAPYKLLWLYLLDECDHSGIWQVDFEVAQIKIGEKLNLEVAIKQLGHNIHVFQNGEKWFIPDFIEFQYGTLKSENRVHQSVLSTLSKYNLLDILLEKNKPLTSPLQGAKDKDKDKELDKDKDTDKEMDKEKSKSLHVKMRETFIEIYNRKKAPLKYSWTGMDGKHLNEIVPQIELQVNDKSEKVINEFWHSMIENLPDWYFQNGFATNIINKNFNQIISKIHKPNATNNANFDRQVAEVLARGNPYARTPDQPA